jgi:GNAT superfamily N-acetyltransferase
MDQSGTVVPLPRAEKTPAARVLAKAFQDDVLYRYVFPDTRERPHALFALWDATIAYVLLRGEAYSIENLKGVATWLRPGPAKLTLEELSHLGIPLNEDLANVDQASQTRLMEMLDECERMRERTLSLPNWYLLGIGIEPKFQGQGLGRRLLQPILNRTDAEKTHCYLETETEDNVRFYQKLGFEVSNQLKLPKGGPTLWAMVRAPQNKRPQIGTPRA